MSALEVNPHYRAFFDQLGMTQPERFLDLPSVIVCGHPDRHVGRVIIGTGACALRAYLKREHRVPWRDRLANAWAGFGLVPKSHREAQLLHVARLSGISCPEWLAHGEDSQGRAFLLVRESEKATELRQHLQEGLRNGDRRRFAQHLGKTLARLHLAGFQHRDLYAKHLLVQADGTITFLDWQRSAQRASVPWKCRWRDLAALHATIRADLMSVRERIICLRAYLRSCRLSSRAEGPSVPWSAMEIVRIANRILRHRHIRELRKNAVAPEKQSLVWLDGEALCLTRAFHAALKGELPDWLTLPKEPDCTLPFERTTRVCVPGYSGAVLVRRRERWPLAVWLRRKSPVSAELRRAGVLFRLERYGVPTPRVLAFGQRSVCRKLINSFLLVALPDDAIDLRAWLANNAWFGSGVSKFLERRRLLRSAAGLLRRVHEAQCYFVAHGAKHANGDEDQFSILVHERSGPSPRLSLGYSASLSARHRPSGRRAATDLVALLRQLTHGSASQTERLRFVLAYLGLSRLTPSVKGLVARVLARSKCRPAPGTLPWRLVQLKAVPVHRGVAP